jgi:serine protease AprX
MRRTLATIALIALALTSWSARPEGQRPPTISDDLQAALARGARARVIVQADASALQSLRARHGRDLRRHLEGALALDLAPEDLRALSASGGVAHLSGDLPVVADDLIANKVTAAEKVWAGTRDGLLGLSSTPGYNGSGIGVAVIDSGINARHSVLAGGAVVARANFVSFEPDVIGDPFGHGTHVAGIIGGTAAAASRVTTLYGGGSAPRVHFVDVRVLGKDGIGYTSDVIAGIDWVIANRARYGIRIINLSLGHPVAEPSATDPLCRAVARAHQAGIVVVASAGNYGRTPDGAPVLGGITSPGNSPFAITVGAIDTRGTVDRRDDVVAPYSSRGPTRFDMTVKPDLVAPGTRIVSLESASSYIASKYPSFHVAGTGSNAYMSLSGTSMAAAVVSGGAALLLDANERLSPAQVKVALQTGATFLPREGLIGAGTGSVDFYASERLVRGGLNGLLGSLLTSVTDILGVSSGASFRDQGTLIDRVYDRSGIRLLGILDLGALLGEANTAEWGVLHLLGESNPIGSAAPNYVVWGNVAGWSESYYVVWGNAIQSPSGQYVVWGNSEVFSEYVIWGNGVVEDPDR